MYKVLTIKNKDYRLEYTIEASLYSDCVREVSDIFMKLETESSAEDIIAKMADIPMSTLNIFYSGLLEHHGPEGDGSVKGLHDAKILAKELLKEGKSWMDILSMCLEQMGEDGFFKLIGVIPTEEEIKEATKE